MFKIHRLTWPHAHPPGPNCCNTAIYNANPDPNSNPNPKEPTPNPNPTPNPKARLGPNPNPKAIEAFPERCTFSHFLFGNVPFTLHPCVICLLSGRAHNLLLQKQHFHCCSPSKLSDNFAHLKTVCVIYLLTV